MSKELKIKDDIVECNYKCLALEFDFFIVR